MVYLLSQAKSLALAIRQMFTVKLFFLISSISFTISIIWIQFLNSHYISSSNDELVYEALENVARDLRYSDVYRKTSRLPKELKYILLWTNKDYSPFDFFDEGQRGFLDNNCSAVNCYITSDRNFFGDNITRFDAIAFNGRNMDHTDLPNQRSPHQKYIYFNMESADNYPICKWAFDGFFNWTSTYRLDSDIPYPYILIRNMKGDFVGPKKDMQWIKSMEDIDEELADKLLNKSKAAAWFVSNCGSRSGRDRLVARLQEKLKPLKLDVDVFGACGDHTCERDRESDCYEMLQRDYFFYMSLENSFDEDYVTEKLLTALQNNVVPIILGGADYSRFLPPGSYLDASKLSQSELAKTMYHIMQNPALYRNFFRWKKYYTYHDPSATDNVCAVCQALNDKQKVEQKTVYKKFRKWWNPEFWLRC